MWAFIYPGQGSQHSGMGQFLFNEFQVAREVFEEASDAISLDLKKLCFTGDEAELSLTQNTQPALLTVSTATSRVLSSISPLKPVAAAGHSIGEYAALVNAESMRFADGIRAVRERGIAMQTAAPVGIGAMAAFLGLSDELVKALCHWVTDLKEYGVLEPANFNTPGQVVVSGHKTALDYLLAHYSNSKIEGLPSRLKSIPLKVSAPFHCSLMLPAEKKMEQVLNSTQMVDSIYPIIQNVSAEPVTSSVTLRQNLIHQVSSPVRWVECVLRMKSMGVRKFVEVGCGKVLSGLVKKIDSESLSTFNINSLEELKALESQLGV